MRLPQGYTPDACMTDPMTAMQSIRMQAMWNAYRSSYSASGQAGAGVVFSHISVLAEHI